VDVTELVPGDVVDLQLGQVVPTDMRLLTTAGLECDESVLTGESTAGKSQAARPNAISAKITAVLQFTMIGMPPTVPTGKAARRGSFRWLVPPSGPAIVLLLAKTVPAGVIRSRRAR
jgi:P-type Mg2+ transporter